MSVTMTAGQKVAFMQEELKPFLEEHEPELIPKIEEYCDILINTEEYEKEKEGYGR